MEKLLPDVIDSISYTINCEFYFDDYIRNKDLENLCGKFKYLYDMVFGSFHIYTSMNEENGEYLNYWLNKELNNKNILSITAPEFYRKLTTTDRTFDKKYKLMKLIHEINPEDLKKMNTLYDIYVIYNKLKTTYVDEQNCKLYSAECVQKFTEAIERGCEDKNDKYCKALKSFKEKYEKSNEDNIFGRCKKEYLSKLPFLTEENEPVVIVMEPAEDTLEVEQPSEEKNKQHLKNQGDLEEERKALIPPTLPSLSSTGENNNDNNISIFTIFGIILSISVFSLITYKFTPFGSWINRRYKRNKINWRNVEDENETKRLLEYNHDPKHLDLRNVPYNVSYNSL